MLQILCRKKKNPQIPEMGKSLEQESSPHSLCVRACLGQKCCGWGGCGEHLCEKLGLVNIREITLGRNAALVGKSFPRGDIAVDIKEFPQDQNLRV